METEPILVSTNLDVGCRAMSRARFNLNEEHHNPVRVWGLVDGNGRQLRFNTEEGTTAADLSRDQFPGPFLLVGVCATESIPRGPLAIVEWSQGELRIVMDLDLDRGLFAGKLQTESLLQSCHVNNVLEHLNDTKLTVLIVIEVMVVSSTEVSTVPSAVTTTVSVSVVSTYLVETASRVSDATWSYMARKCRKG